MTDRAKNEVGQLRLVDGTQQVSPANMGVAERRTILPLNISGRGKGRLHVLIELTGGAFGRPEMAQDLVRAITDEYYGTPGTITYGLRQAVLLANAYLRRSNERIAAEHRLGGVACVALRGREAFVAQAGWPVVYLLRDQELIDAYPDTTLENLDESVLGQQSAIEVRLFRLPIRSGDTILMLDGPMARHLAPEKLGAWVTGSDEWALHNLEAMAPPTDCSAMIVRVPSISARTQKAADQWTYAPVEQGQSAESPETDTQTRQTPDAPPARRQVHTPPRQAPYTAPADRLLYRCRPARPGRTPAAGPAIRRGGLASRGQTIAARGSRGTHGTATAARARPGQQAQRTGAANQLGVGRSAGDSHPRALVCRWLYALPELVYQQPVQ
jgi:hypothetical protein